MHGTRPDISRRHRGRRLLRQGADAILNLLYPEVCLVCREPVARSEACAVCDRCWEEVGRLRITPPLCPCCGLPFPNSAERSGHLCGACIGRLPSFSGAHSFGYYTAELSRILQSLKFEGRQNLAPKLASLLTTAFYEWWRRDEVDGLLAVPLHSARKRERGFNQAALLCRALAKNVAVPHVEGALKRVRNTRPQVGLKDLRRRRNMRGAFLCVKPELVGNRRMLLVDDVMTTGATADSAAAALRQAGALSISVLTVARTVPGAL